MLTPDEFVKAGDHLIRTCPSWQWQTGDVAKRRPYLPLDKQYLITKGKHILFCGELNLGSFFE